MSGAYRVNKLPQNHLILFPSHRDGPSQSGSNEAPFLTGTLLSYSEGVYKALHTQIDSRSNAY